MVVAQELHRLHLDPRRVHRQKERGQPLLGMVVGACVQHQVRRHPGIRDEHLIAIDYIAATFRRHRPRRNLRDITARPRLGQANAADDLARRHPRRKPFRCRSRHHRAIAAEPLHRKHQVIQRRHVPERGTKQTQRRHRHPRLPRLHHRMPQKPRRRQVAERRPRRLQRRFVDEHRQSCHLGKQLLGPIGTTQRCSQDRAELVLQRTRHRGRLAGWLIAQRPTKFG